MLLVLTTTSSAADAEVLAGQVVASKLAACVQIIPGVRSVYFWDGQMKHEAEHLLIIKTLSGEFEELESFIRANHSYDVPEIVAIESERVSGSYLDWLTTSLDRRAVD